MRAYAKAEVGYSHRVFPAFSYQRLVRRLTTVFICLWLVTYLRRYIAMVEMCQIVGNRDQLITLLLQLAEHVLNIILIHLQDRYTTLSSTIDILNVVK